MLLYVQKCVFGNYDYYVLVSIQIINVKFNVFLCLGMRGQLLSAEPVALIWAGSSQQ